MTILIAGAIYAIVLGLVMRHLYWRGFDAGMKALDEAIERQGMMVVKREQVEAWVNETIARSRSSTKGTGK